MILATITRIIGKNIEYHAVNSKEGESILMEIWEQLSRFVYSVPNWMIVVAVIIAGVLFTRYLLTGRPQGSHAGREGVRRAYRRELAKQMAREDAKKIQAGEKPRRRWMQW